MKLSDLDEYAETTIAQRLSMVNGVAQVSVFGSQKYAVRIELDPAQLTARNLSVSQVATAVRTNNVTLPTGVLYGNNRTLTVQATGQLYDAAQFRNMVVAEYNNAPVHFGDLGRVYDDVQNDKTASWYNGDRAIVLAVTRQPGTNTVEVADAAKAALARDPAVAAAAGEDDDPLRSLCGNSPGGGRREVLAGARARRSS